MCAFSSLSLSLSLDVCEPVSLPWYWCRKKSAVHAKRSTKFNLISTIWPCYLTINFYITIFSIIHNEDVGSCSTIECSFVIIRMTEIFFSRKTKTFIASYSFIKFKWFFINFNRITSKLLDFHGITLQKKTTRYLIGSSEIILGSTHSIFQIIRIKMDTSNKNDLIKFRKPTSFRISDDSQTTTSWHTN